MQLGEGMVPRGTICDAITRRPYNREHGINFDIDDVLSARTIFFHCHRLFVKHTVIFAILPRIDSRLMYVYMSAYMSIYWHGLVHLYPATCLCKCQRPAYGTNRFLV